MDLVYLFAIAAFFALAAGLVHGCDALTRSRS